MKATGQRKKRKGSLGNNTHHPSSVPNRVFRYLPIYSDDFFYLFLSGFSFFTRHEDAKLFVAVALVVVSDLVCCFANDQRLPHQQQHSKSSGNLVDYCPDARS